MQPVPYLIEHLDLVVVRILKFQCVPPVANAMHQDLKGLYLVSLVLDVVPLCCTLISALFHILTLLV